MFAPSSGVRLGVPRSRSVVPSDGRSAPPLAQARQFEYHPSQTLMGIGTLAGEVILADWNSNQLLATEVLPGARDPHREHSSVLALCWLRNSPDKLIAGCAVGAASLYTVNQDALRIQQDEDLASQPSVLSLRHQYSAPVIEQMTSLHCNSTDTLISSSGYTHHVNVRDLETGALLRRLKNIHSAHINLARFANQLPYLLLTCSFDRTLCAFDLRSNARINRSGADSSDDLFNVESASPKPIYSCSSSTGNVMVCWSPDDLHFLSSAVDNEVKQWATVDGRLDLEVQIPRLRSDTNFTRSYYANQGEAIISGSSGSDLLYVCSSVDGKVLDTVDITEGRKDDQLYIQSLRGCPLPDQHNRCAVLVCSRQQTASQQYELIDVDLNRSPGGAAREHPLSLTSIIHMASDYGHFRGRDFAADVVISCEGAQGDQLIYAHQAILHSRWPWFAKHAVWTKDAPLAQTQAASTSVQAQAAPIVKKESDSLDSDDEDTPMVQDETPLTPAATPGVATSESLIFCRITVPHPSSSTSSTAAAFDTITISSAGVVSLELPRMSRTRCMYLLEYLYTGGLPVQSLDEARAATSSSTEADEAKRRAEVQRARRDQDYDVLAAVAREDERKAAEDDLKGLDDEDADEQAAIMASMRFSSNTTTGPLDVHSALVSLSQRATPETAGTTLGLPCPKLPPLSASFSAKLAMYTLASAVWYDLPRLGNILERAMRKQLRLSWDVLNTEEGQLDDAATAQKSATSSSSASASSSSSADERAPALVVFHRRLEACVRVGAQGLVMVACDLIERAYDWLALVHPWLLAELPALFPSTESTFIAELQQRRTNCLDQTQTVQATQTGFVIVEGVGPSAKAGQAGLVVWTGGASMKSTPPMGPLHVLHTQSLRVAHIAAHTPGPTRSTLDDSLTAHAAAVLHTAEGAPSHMVLMGGQSVRVLESRLRVLDLRTLCWQEQELEGRPRARKKHTFTAVPAMRRAYVFAGRDTHHVFGDLHILDCAAADPRAWTWTNVQELHAMKGVTSIVNPAVRFAHTCNYSATAGGLVLFGGNGIAGCRNDVWVLDPVTNTWECKIQNDPALLGAHPDDHLAHVHEHGESSPLPRHSHSATVVSVDLGRGEGMVEHLAVFGGVTAFLEGQVMHSDLWLLNLETFVWRKVHASNASPPMPVVDFDADDAIEQMERHLALELENLPSKRWDHGCFIQPYAEAPVLSAMSAAAVAALANPALIAPVVVPLRTSGRFCVVGGTTLRDAVPWVDVFDFATGMWARENAHPASVQPMPCINIEDRGCLWTDMQARFRCTQPQPFDTPIVAQDSVTADQAAVLAPIPSATLPSSSSSAPTTSMDACISYNLSFERAQYHSATPLPSGSFVHFLVEGRVLTVPKVILASRCPTFLSMLTSTIRDSNLEHRNLIVLEGVRYVIFRCILYWVYCGDEEFVLELFPRSQPTRTLSSSSSSSSSSRGTKRNGDDLDDLLSLGGLNLERAASFASASKKSKNGHASPEEQATAPPTTLDEGGLDDDETMTTTASTSETTIGPDYLTVDPLEVLVAADRFNLPSLCSVLEIGLSRQIDVSVVCNFLFFAETYNLAHLQARCVIFIIQHYEDVTSSYSSEYSRLPSSTRESIDSGLSALCGSHRGPTSRGEPNPLLARAAGTVAAGAAEAQEDDDEEGEDDDMMEDGFFSDEDGEEEDGEDEDLEEE